MTIQTFTVVHTALSLIGIVAGLVVVFGMLGGKQSGKWTALFLLTTVLTSVTGFLFPVEHLLPSHVIGIISLIVLAIAIFALYFRNLGGGWRRTYVVSTAIALYLNVFVLFVQSFLKVPALHAMAPTQKEPPFLVAQLIVMALFVVLTIAAAKKFRNAAA